MKLLNIDIKDLFDSCTEVRNTFNAGTTMTLLRFAICNLSDMLTPMYNRVSMESDEILFRHVEMEKPGVIKIKAKILGIKDRPGEVKPDEPVWLSDEHFKQYNTEMMEYWKKTFQVKGEGDVMVDYDMPIKKYPAQDLLNTTPYKVGEANLYILMKVLSL